MKKYLNSIRSKLKKRFTKVIKEPIYIPVLEGNILKGRVFFVTGATGGIGFAICESFLKNGATVIFAGRNESKIAEKLIEIKNRYPDFSNNVYPITFNTDENLDDIINQINSNISPNKIDGLVNCIGMSKGDPFRYTKQEDFDAVINTNLKSTYFISQTFANYFINNNIQGNILNISSVSGIRPANTPYMLSKWCLNGLTKGLAKQLSSHKIVVNGIAPGPTATEMLKLDGSDLNYCGAPIGRFTSPIEVANLAVFLVSDMGKMITGETINISGGCGNLTFDDIPY